MNKNGIKDLKDKNNSEVEIATLHNLSCNKVNECSMTEVNQQIFLFIYFFLVYLMYIINNPYTQLSFQRTNKDWNKFISWHLTVLKVNDTLKLAYSMWPLHMHNDFILSPTPNRKLLAFFFFFKRFKHCLVCFRPFGLWRHRKYIHSCSHCNTYVIIHICILINHVCQITHSKNLLAFLYFYSNII